jgi:methylmalonyl-CoA mutase
LKRLKAERNQAEVDAAACDSRGAPKPARGNLSISRGAGRAGRKHVSGKYRYALEKVWGRHRAEIRSDFRRYKQEVGRCRTASSGLRRLAKPLDRRRPPAAHPRRQDGAGRHDRGQKVIASAFADLGFDVDIGPLFATPAEAARQAIENDVHIIGVSSLAAGHLTLVPELRDELAQFGREDIVIVVGGVIPPQDFDALYAAGASAIFPPGTVIADAAEKLIHELNRRLGYGPRAAAE